MAVTGARRSVCCSGAGNIAVLTTGMRAVDVGRLGVISVRFIATLVSCVSVGTLSK
jgi:hypothetical protein